MKRYFFLFLAILCLQTGWSQIETAESTKVNESPLDGIVSKPKGPPPPILKYETYSPNEILWKKVVWRVIDTKEMMNQAFVYPKERFSEILADGAQAGELKTYRRDDFKERMSQEEIHELLVKTDTIYVIDPLTYEEKMVIVENVLNHEDIQRYRVKELWYIDNQSSRMNVRILGIAPLKNDYDENGNFRFEMPLFWVHYPESRSYLAKFKVFNPWNDHQLMSWNDHLEMRFFASYIYKENNVYDRRLKDYLTEVDLLLEAQKIHDEIFNFEQDLWSK